MTTQEAISFFAKIGWKVNKVGRGKYRIWEIGGGIKENWRDNWNDVWAGRDMVRFANSLRNHQKKVKQLTREEENSKNRSATRDLIKKKEFDKIPKEGKVKEGNPWNWD